jgi:hypothetical protein
MVPCNASYYGTVAARAGIPVVAVDTGLLSTGRRSRYSNSYLSSPPFESADWPDWQILLAQRCGMATGRAVDRPQPAVCAGRGSCRLEQRIILLLFE